MYTKLTALVFNCTLKPSPAESSTDKLAAELVAELSKHNVESETIRLVDYDIKPGVTTDEGNGDAWPQLRQKLLAADIFVMATPTWVGQMSSVALRVIERLDAELSETDEAGRPLVFGKVAAAVIVGNEDGAHKITADLFQALNDVGFTVAAQAATYWNGEAMHSIDYKDLSETPKAVASATATVASNAAHLAALLKQAPYPAVES